MNNDVTKMSVVELKALGYDLLAALENVQKNLAIVNKELERKSQELASKSQEMPTPVVEEKVEEKEEEK